MDNQERPHISIKDLNMYYGKNHALKNINIDIPNGKLTAIIGPSGCGKTTLLKTFNRLLENVDGVTITGEVLVEGENIYDKNADVTSIRKNGLAQPASDTIAHEHI